MLNDLQRKIETGVYLVLLGIIARAGLLLYFALNHLNGVKLSFDSFDLLIVSALGILYVITIIGMWRKHAGSARAHLIFTVVESVLMSFGLIFGPALHVFSTEDPYLGAYSNIAFIYPVLCLFAIVSIAVTLKNIYQYNSSKQTGSY